MTYVEIFSSYLITECDQRAFVLKAVGIEHVVVKNDNKVALLVAEDFSEHAVAHLHSYAEESRPKPQPAAVPLHA